VRPSYVLGGRAMEIVHDEAGLRHYMDRAVEIGPGRPVLVDEFLDDAIELDVDAISDGVQVMVGGIMNVQFAIKGSDVYILEVNPRASRTVPFVSKAIGVPLAKLAARVM